MASQSVGDAAIASSSSAAIAPALWEEWLGRLRPDALRVVLADAIVYGAAGTIPAAFRERAFDLGPSIARLVAGADSALLSRPPAPVLAQTPDGRLYYSAAGTRYRLVPPGSTASSLEINPAAAVAVDSLELPLGASWPAGATPSSAFADEGRLVAAGGSSIAAYAFAKYWRRMVA